MTSSAVYLQTTADIRREQLLVSTKQELCFWKDKAENLQDALEKIFDLAEQSGAVTICQRGKRIELHVRPSTPNREDAGT